MKAKTAFERSLNLSKDLGKSDINIAYSLYGLGKVHYELQLISESKKYLSEAKKILDSSTHKAYGFEQLNLKIDILPILSLVLFEQNNITESLIEYYKKIIIDIDELSIEGLYFFLDLIKKIIQKNKVENNLILKKYNIEKEYKSTLQFTYNKIHTISKNIDSREFQKSFINEVPIHKTIVEEWDKME